MISKKRLPTFEAGVFTEGDDRRETARQLDEAAYFANLDEKADMWHRYSTKRLHALHTWLLVAEGKVDPDSDDPADWEWKELKEFSEPRGPTTSLNKIFFTDAQPMLARLEKFCDQIRALWNGLPRGNGPIAPRVDALLTEWESQYSVGDTARWHFNYRTCKAYPTNRNRYAQFARALFKNRHRLGWCRNPECKTPYFILRRKDSKYCKTCRKYAVRFRVQKSRRLKEKAEKAAAQAAKEGRKKRPRGTGSFFVQSGPFDQRKPGEILWLRYSHFGKVHRESSGTNKIRDAERLLQKRLAELRQGNFISPLDRRRTVDELYAALLTEYSNNNQLQSLIGARARWEYADKKGIVRTGRLKAFFSGVPAVNIDKGMLNRYISLHLAEGNISNATTET
jgi:hypothetical protein